MSDPKPFRRTDVVEWVKPFLDHIGRTVNHVIEIHIGPEAVIFRLVDTHDPTSDFPTGHPLRSPSADGDEFAKATYQAVFPIAPL